jgi:hypothetical protein
MSFFDRFKPNKDKKNKTPNLNIFSNFKLPGQNNFSGNGQSLGGSQPGKVIDVQLDDPGPLGVKIEKRPNSQGTAIVAIRWFQWHGRNYVRHVYSASSFGSTTLVF